MTSVGKTMFPLSNSIQNITSMKSRYDELQLQLATGQKAKNLAQMGSDRYFDLSIRARMARTDSYQSNIKTVSLRLDLMDTVVSRLSTIESDARATTVSGNSGASTLNYQTTPTLATSRLDEVLSLLNTDLAGRFLFGGSTTEKTPVAGPGAIMNGEGGKAGFKTVAGERLLADLGADHLGRLGVSTATNTVTLAEQGTHPFGMKLSNVSSSTANIAVTSPSGAPPSLSVAFGATLPIEGDKVTVGLTLPDGSEEQIVLTATTGDATPGAFKIGADADETAANFGTALNASVKEMAETKMAVASSYAAADNFFNGQGETVQRVDGPPFDTATGLVDATAGNTVLWYSGEDSADARKTITSKVGDTTSVAYGAQANEGGFVGLIRSLAAMSIQVFSDTDPTSGSRYAAAVNRNTDRLSESSDEAGAIQVIAVELGLAKTTATTVGARHTAQNAQLGNMLGDLEEAPTEQVSMEILSLKTRLEASYATTSMLSQLSLVNYLK